MAGLRERRHQETRRAVVDAAFALFADRGFAQVTMEEIATAAGVSRSTAYRRFPTKEDVVLEVPRRWLTVFDAAVERLDPTATLAEATRAACLAVAGHIDDNRDTVLAAYRVLDEAPSLRAAGGATSAWLERIVELVDRFGDLDQPAEEKATLDAGIIAGAYLGAIDAMMQLWASSGGATSVTKATMRVVDRLEPILR